MNEKNVNYTKKIIKLTKFKIPKKIHFMLLLIYVKRNVKYGKINI